MTDKFGTPNEDEPLPGEKPTEKDLEDSGADEPAGTEEEGDDQ